MEKTRRTLVAVMIGVRSRHTFSVYRIAYFNNSRERMKVWASLHRWWKCPSHSYILKPIEFQGLFITQDVDKWGMARKLINNFRHAIRGFRASARSSASAAIHARLWDTTGTSDIILPVWPQILLSDWESKQILVFYWILYVQEDSHDHRDFPPITFAYIFVALCLNSYDYGTDV